MKKQLVIVCLASLLCGCASMTPVQKGALVGGVTGAVIGGAATHGAGTTKAAAVGAGIGALAGAAVGHWIGTEPQCAPPPPATDYAPAPPPTARPHIRNNQLDK